MYFPAPPPCCWRPSSSQLLAASPAPAATFSSEARSPHHLGAAEPDHSSQPLLVSRLLPRSPGPSDWLGPTNPGVHAGHRGAPAEPSCSSSAAPHRAAPPGCIAVRCPHCQKTVAAALPAGERQRAAQYTEEVYGPSSGGQPLAVGPASSAATPGSTSLPAILDAEASGQGTHPLAGQHLQDSVSTYDNIRYQYSSSSVYNENPTGLSCLPDTDADTDEEYYTGIYNYEYYREKREIAEEGGPGQLASPLCPLFTGDPVAGNRLQVPGPILLCCHCRDRDP